MPAIVSILVPVFNVEGCIEKCAKSIFEQTFEDIEYVFVNDCTPDQSIKILQSVISKYPKRQDNIKIINHAANKGLSQARNTAISHASGEYILHVDSDDYLELDTVELLINKAIADGADIVVTDLLWQFKTYSTIFKHKYVANKKDYLNALISKESSANVCAKLIKRSIYEDNKISAPVNCNYGEDYSVYPRLVYYANRISYMGSPLYHYVQYNESSYIKNVNEEMLNALCWIISDLEIFFSLQEENNQFSEAFKIARLKVKSQYVSSLSKSGRLKYRAIFSDIPFKNYKNSLSRLEYGLLYLNNSLFFSLIGVLKLFFYLGGNIKRSIKTYLNK